MSKLKLCPVSVEAGQRIVRSLRANAFFSSAWEQIDAGIGKEYFECLFAEIVENSYHRAQPANSRFADCHIWEPGDRLDTISDKCEVLVKAADIRALMAQPDNKGLTWAAAEELQRYRSSAHPANEPLTLDELREMDGEPVYDGHDLQWYVIEGVDVVDELSTVIHMTDGTDFDSEDGLPPFYRCKP